MAVNTPVASKTINPKFDGLSDTREDKATDNLLHTSRTHTRSGHYIEYNDNEGVEHITVQHRSGSLLQMQPDGSVRMVSQNGMMGIEINGEGYVKVTGAYNVIVDGDASFRIAQDAHWYVGGDLKMTVDGTYSIAAKNMTTTIQEKYELTAANQSIAMSENSIFTAGGKLATTSKGAMLTKSEATYTIEGAIVDINP